MMVRRTAGSWPRARVRAGTTTVLALVATLAVGGAVPSGARAAQVPDTEDLREGLVAEYLFEETTGATVHNTADGTADDGDPLDAIIHHYAAAQRAERGTLQFTGGAKSSTGNWVELPDDLLADASSATVSIDVKAHSSMLRSNHFLWNIGNEQTQQYWFTTTRNARSAITTASAGGEDNATGYPLVAEQWHSLSAVIDADAGTITLYTDGQRSGVRMTDVRPADISQTLNTIGRAPYNDPLFRGAVSSFRVYDRALTDREVLTLAEHDAQEHADELRAVADAKLAALDLGDTSAVTSDLDLFTLREISWESSAPAVLAGDGAVTRPAPGAPDVTVELTATAAQRGVTASAPRSFEVVVPALRAADIAADADALELPDAALGNLALVGRGPLGSPVSWTSSDPAVVSDVRAGGAAPGVVTRPQWGQPAAEVTLTATIGEGAHAVTREFPVTVPAAPRPAVDNRYLFTYFTGDTLAGEQIYAAASRGNSAMTWDVLGNGAPILSSTEGTGGLRDPFIMRSAEGDRFFLIATDLSIGSGTSWEQALDDGSTHLEIWESTDLRTWSEQRHVEVSGPFASMTWAPEAYWDEQAGEYVVYWSSRLFLDSRPYDKASTPDHTYSKVMYATTRDFVTFSDAVVWQDAGDRIDTTMIEDDGRYYRFTKEVTGCVDIVQESSDDMRAPTVAGDHAWQTDATCISKTARDTGRTTEGPTIFRANPGDTSLPAGTESGFYMFVDDFTGAGYLPLFTETLADPQWRTVPGSLPSSRHGSVMPVTLNQWESAKGLEPSQVGTVVEIVTDGDVLQVGDTVSVRVTAEDGGVVAGDVDISLGEHTVTVPVEQSGEGYLASLVLDDWAAAGQATVTAAYRGFDVLAASAPVNRDVVVGGAGLDLSVVVDARCVVGRVAQVVRVTNGEDVPVAVSLSSPHGAREARALAPGRTVSYAFSTRQPTIAGGVLDVTAEAIGGARRATSEVAYPAASCR